MGFTLLELIIAVVILAVLATIAIPTFARDIASSVTARDTVTLTAAANDVRSITTSGGGLPTSLPSASDIATGLAEVKIAGVGPLTGVASTIASPVPSTSYGVVSYDNTDSANQVGYAMMTQNGDCSMALTTGNTTQSWNYVASLGANCNGSNALNGPNQSAPGFVTTSYDQLVTSMHPAAWWKLADAAGSTTAADSSGNGYTGTVNGGVTLGQPGAIASTPSDTAALFDGSTGYITSSFAAPMASATTVAWFNMPATNINALILNSSTSGGYNIGVSNGTGSAVGDTLTLGLPFVIAVPTGVAVAPGWHQVVLVLDASGHQQVFYDGQLVYSGTYTIATAPAAWEIGGAGNSAWWPSDIAQVAVFPTALTAAQVLALYNAGK